MKAAEAAAVAALAAAEAAVDAEGIAIADPARGDQVIEVVRESGGTVVTVEDAETLAARDDLAASGLFVEPTAAAAWAATSRLVADGSLGADGPVVVELTGAGLKSV